MSSWVVAGLPIHPLLVHVMVVLTPAVAIALVVHVFWPAAARRLGIFTPLAALVVLVLTPFTTRSGGALRDVVAPSDAVEHHAELGDTLLPWVVALFVVAVAVWLWLRQGKRSAKQYAARRMSAAGVLSIDIVLKLAAVAVAIGTVTVVILIGDSGARAVWGGIVSP